MEQKEFWQKIESFLNHYELSYTPVRWFGGWGGFTREREGYFILFRLFFLIALYVAAFYSLSHSWLEILMAIVTGYNIADMFLLPTSLAFVTISDTRPLRAVVLVFITYISISVGFGVLYITLCRSSFNPPADMIDIIYFSFTTITALGTGSVSLVRHAVLVRVLTISEILIGIYFWAVLIGVIISWRARDFRR